MGEWINHLNQKCCNKSMAGPVIYACNLVKQDVLAGKFLIDNHCKTIVRITVSDTLIIF